MMCSALAEVGCFGVAVVGYSRVAAVVDSTTILSTILVVITPSFFTLSSFASKFHIRGLTNVCDQ